MTKIMISVGIPGPCIRVNIAMVFMGILGPHYNFVTWTGERGMSERGNHELVESLQSQLTVYAPVNEM